MSQKDEERLEQACSEFEELALSMYQTVKIFGKRLYADGMKIESALKEIKKYSNEPQKEYDRVIEQLHQNLVLLGKEFGEYGGN
jgi:hypothetical protein